MDYFVGLDVSVLETAVCVVDDCGQGNMRAADLQAEVAQGAAQIGIDLEHLALHQLARRQRHALTAAFKRASPRHLRAWNDYRAECLWSDFLQV